MICFFFLSAILSAAVSSSTERLGHLNISSGCSEDIQTWLVAIEHFGAEAVECIAERGNCSQATKEKLGKDFFALKQLDAFGRQPAGFLDLTFTSPGSVAECKEVGDNFYYGTQYCYLNSHLSPNCTGLPTFRKAICMPRSCTEEDILEIFDHYRAVSLLHHCSVDCLPTESETDAFFWIYSSFMLALATLCLMATITDYLAEGTTLFASVKSSLGMKLLLMFSFYTNGAAILDTAPPKQGHLRCVDCIRFLSMLWVVSGHVMEMWLHNDSLYVLGTVGDPILSDTLTNAFFAVDTFFALSGIMVSYLFFKAVLKNRNVVKSSLTWILFYVHRYLRLTPPYMLFICFYIAFVPFFGGLAVIDLNLPQTVEVCRKYWWKNLLYFNNFDDSTNCYGHTWYLACDMQIYIVAPLFLLCFYFNHLLGAASIVVACAGSVGLTFGMVYHYDIEVSEDRYQTQALFSKKLYSVPWIRCTPYLIGIWAGYILATKRLSKRANWYPLVSLILWCFFLAVALACVYGAHDYLDFHTNWSKFTRSAYYSFSRIGWGLFVSWVVLANFYGYGGPIAKFMEHPLWQPLGRLSYTAYLVHRFITYYFFDLLDKPLHFASIWQQFLGYTIPITLMSYTLALLWSCLCEIPILKVEKFCVEKVIGGMTERENKEKKEDNWASHQEDRPGALDEAAQGKEEDGPEE